MDRLIFTALTALLIAAAAQSQVPIIGGDGASLNDLKERGSFVTVVLKGSNARDVNLRITDVLSDRFTFVTANGEPSAYLFSQVAEIRVQLGKIRTSRPSSPRALSTGDVDVLERSGDRAYEILTQHAGNQAYRLWASSMLVASKHPQSAAAIEDLKRLAQSNDVPTQVIAAFYLYLAGQPVDPEIIRRGLGSGKRNARATAIQLTGLSGDNAFIPTISGLIDDPSPDVYPYAAVALAHLGEVRAIPGMIRGIQSLNEEKAEAATVALTTLGATSGREEVVAAVRPVLETASGFEWFRALRILYALGDEAARELMRTRAADEPAFTRNALIILTEDGDWDASVRLREMVSAVEDPTQDSLSFRARASAALVAADYPPAKTLLQQILRTGPNDVFIRGRAEDQAAREEAAKAVRILACEAVARSGQSSLLALLLPAVESADPEVALTACEAAIALADPDYRDRVLRSKLKM